MPASPHPHGADCAPPVDARKARELILSGRAPADMRVIGHLDLSGQSDLRSLPAGLAVASLDLRGCTALRELPGELRVRRLNLEGCTGLEALPDGLQCFELELGHTRLRALPPGLRVVYRLDMSGCAELEALPDGLKVGSLILRGCAALRALPEGLDVYFLDISGCAGLVGWPRAGSLRVGRLDARGCARLQSLPPWLGGLAQLDLRGCASLTALPDGLTVSSWLDIADSGVRALPDSLRGARLRWNGVPVDERVAFRPETITVQEVLGESNVERRRVLLERMGYDAFLERADAQVLDRDRDPGGERRLLRVPLQGDEDLVCVAVICPSTGRQYIIRVPPKVRSCRQAVAWIAGFDNPNDYRPIAET